MMVYVSTAHTGQWHVLASAFPGGTITTACAVSVPYCAVLVATAIPVELRCEACCPVRALPDNHNFDRGATEREPWSCPAGSYECRIRQACTNKCGQLDGSSNGGDL